jgi:hypothetical protein
VALNTINQTNQFSRHTMDLQTIIKKKEEKKTTNKTGKKPHRKRRYLI